MVSTDLKEHTHRAHTLLEKKLIGHIKAICTVGDYIRLLEMMYGFYHPLEELIKPFIASRPMISDRRGRQAENILKDIDFFNRYHHGHPTVCRQLPDITSYASSLGAMYVMEGSTLGGRIIAGMVAKRLGLEQNDGFSFFNTYGEETLPMWDNFKEHLNQQWSQEERHAMMESALSTFITFNNWIVEYESIASAQVRF